MVVEHAEDLARHQVVVVVGVEVELRLCTTFALVREEEVVP